MLPMAPGAFPTFLVNVTGAFGLAAAVILTERLPTSGLSRPAPTYLLIVRP